MLGLETAEEKPVARFLWALTKHDVGDDARKHKDAQEGERDDEDVKVPVVSLPYTIPHPRAMVVKPLCKTKTKIQVWW